VVLVLGGRFEFSGVALLYNRICDAMLIVNSDFLLFAADHGQKQLPDCPACAYQVDARRALLCKPFHLPLASLKKRHAIATI